VRLHGARPEPLAAAAGQRLSRSQALLVWRTNRISVLDRAAMLEVQREPDKHRDLIVRVGGYSEYFANLNRQLQDNVIARTEHGMG